MATKRSCPAPIDVPMLLTTALVFIGAFSWAAVLHASLRQSAHIRGTPEYTRMRTETAVSALYALVVSMVAVVVIWLYARRIHRLHNEGCRQPGGWLGALGGATKSSQLRPPVGELLADETDSDEMVAQAGDAVFLSALGGAGMRATTPPYMLL